jgi:hypothetical protein
MKRGAFMEFGENKIRVPIDTFPRGSGTELKTALFQVLQGIEKTWKIEQSELAAILHRSASTVSDWKTKKAVSVSVDNPSPNDAQIYELIEFYDSVASLFIRVEDQIGWLKTKSQDFGGKSPLELLKIQSKNLFALREWVDHVARP